MTTRPFKMDGVTVVTHPLVAHKLSIMRAKDTSTARFRDLLREISTLLCYEVTRDLPLEDYPVETPVGPTTGQRIAGKKMVFVPILRAGLGLVDGMLELVRQLALTLEAPVWDKVRKPAPWAASKAAGEPLAA